MNILYFRLAAIFAIFIFAILWFALSSRIPKVLQYIIAGLVDIMCIAMLFAVWESRVLIGVMFAATTAIFWFKNVFPGSGTFLKSTAERFEDGLEERRWLVSMVVDYMVFVGCAVLFFEFLR